MVNLYDLELLQILPSSISGDKNVQAASRAIDKEIQSVSSDIVEALIVSRIDKLPEPVVDLLAWQWHVDFYELARTLEMKRATVKNSIPWHRKKGTKWAIKKALESLGVKPEIVEWWKIEGAVPYTFAVEAEITDKYWRIFPNVDDVTRMIRDAVEESKAARSWLMRLHTFIQDKSSLDVAHGIVTVTSPHVAIRPAVPQISPTRVAFGVATGQFYKVTIGPTPGQIGE
ncbi:hypothetical protein FACS1894204_04040 [Synergistales bacterium]|nr:hypothetical protein FACS1894204_04040 [Synergistales bacterium]